MEPARDAAYPACWSAAVRVTLGDGRTIEAAQDRPKGDPENPLTPAELEEKFRSLATAGGIAAPRIDALLDWLRALAGTGPLDLDALRALAFTS